MNDGITEDPFKVLTLCANTKSLKERKEILRQNDTPDVRNVLLYAKSPLFTYNVSGYTFEEPTEHQEGFTHQFNWAFITLDFIHSAGGMNEENKDEIFKKIRIASSNMNVEQQQVFGWMLDKDFGFKLEPSTINDVFKNLIPLLRTPSIEYVEGESEVKFPIIVEPMRNGDILIITIRNGEVRKFDENSSLVVGDFKYDKELLKIFDNGVNLLCVSTDTTNSKLIVHDMLSNQELKYGLYTGNKMEIDTVLEQKIGSGCKFVKKSNPVMVYSRKELEKFKSKNTDKSLIGFLLRSPESTKHFIVETV